MGDHTIVLLGAGASKEAGVPLTTEMTEALVNTVDADPRSQYNGTWQALVFACGAL
jgi:hypothetical protein